MNIHIYIATIRQVCKAVDPSMYITSLLPDPEKLLLMNMHSIMGVHVGYCARHTCARFYIHGGGSCLIVLRSRVVLCTAASDTPTSYMQVSPMIDPTGVPVAPPPTRPISQTSVQRSISKDPRVGRVPAAQAYLASLQRQAEVRTSMML